jgi:hypothetical protein
MDHGRCQIAPRGIHNIFCRIDYHNDRMYHAPNKWGLPPSVRLIARSCMRTMAGVCLLLYLSGCAPAPAEHQVTDAISAYFMARDLQVVRLEIRSIEREPMGARQYMGPRRYIVDVQLITLQPVQREGGQVDYRNVKITIRKNTASVYGVNIDDVSIIPF